MACYLAYRGVRLVCTFCCCRGLKSLLDLQIVQDLGAPLVRTIVVCAADSASAFLLRTGCTAA